MFRTDGNSGLAQIPAIRLNMLFEDKENDISEIQFSDNQFSIKSDSHVDFGGYFPTDRFSSDTNLCIQELLNHAWSKMDKNEISNNHHLLVGDDLSSHCYQDHTLFLKDSSFYFT
jgi:hypothetical protein